MVINNYHRIHYVTAITGVFAITPVILFVSLNILKFESGLLSDFEIYPVHPAILLGGGMAAILLNAWSIFEFRMTHQNEKVWLSFGLTNRPWNIAVLSISIVFLFVLVSYVILENVAPLFDA